MHAYFAIAPKTTVKNVRLVNCAFQSLHHDRANILPRPRCSLPHWYFLGNCVIIIWLCCYWASVMTCELAFHCLKFLQLKKVSLFLFVPNIYLQYPLKITVYPLKIIILYHLATLSPDDRKPYTSVTQKGPK